MYLSADESYLVIILDVLSVPVHPIFMLNPNKNVCKRKTCLLLFCFFCWLTIIAKWETHSLMTHNIVFQLFYFTQHATNQPILAFLSKNVENK